MLRYHSLIHIGIVELDGPLPCQPSNKHHHHGVAFADAVAWRWRISPPHPREPLRKGLAEDGVRGFYLVWLTG